MPCYDPRDREPNYGLSQELKDSEKENAKLTAMFCALTNEVLSHQDGLQLIKDAETNGKINITDFIKEHSKEDKERIKDVISEEFSIHELNLLKEMIKNKEL